jgi:hypothetical protein
MKKIKAKRGRRVSAYQRAVDAIINDIIKRAGEHNKALREGGGIKSCRSRAGRMQLYLAGVAVGELRTGLAILNATSK